MSMWSHHNVGDETNKPVSAAGTPLPAQTRAPAPNPGPGSAVAPAQAATRGVVNIGKSISIKGELNGSEDLTLEGQFEGRIELTDHAMTIGPSARVTAELFARAVIVHGQVTGNIRAAELISLRETGSVEGDLVAPRVGIEDGASFNGRIVMQTGQPTKAKAPSARSMPAPVAKADSRVSTAKVSTAAS